MSNKILKWEMFFVFDDGERESMYEITRKPGKKLLAHELASIDDYNCSHDQNMIMVVTYSDGTLGEI